MAAPGALHPASSFATCSARIGASISRTRGIRSRAGSSPGPARRRCRLPARSRAGCSDRWSVSDTLGRSVCSMISGHAYCSAVRRARPPDQNCCWMHYAKAPTPVMSRPIGGPGKQARRSPEDGPSLLDQFSSIVGGPHRPMSTDYESLEGLPSASTPSQHVRNVEIHRPEFLHSSEARR
jgi:hypothetical protein